MFHQALLGLPVQRTGRAAQGKWDAIGLPVVQAGLESLTMDIGLHGTILYAPFVIFDHLCLPGASHFERARPFESAQHLSTWLIVKY
jgi:hypothetical protein